MLSWPYNEFSHAIAPVQRLVFPDTVDPFYAIPHIANLIKEDLDTYITPQAFTAVVGSVPTLARNWANGKRAETLALLPGHLQTMEGRLGSMSLNDAEDQLAIDFRDTMSSLDNAAAVFVRVDAPTRALVGRDVFRTWQGTNIQLQFSERGSAAGAAVSHAVGELGAKLRRCELDPKSSFRATALLLDYLDLRYFCQHCHTRDLESQQFVAYNWRACVRSMLF